MIYRRHKYGYEFRRIYLGEGEWTILDQQDYYRFGGFKWSFMGNRGKVYAVRSTRIKKDKIKILPLHREIMKPRKGFVVDHKNCDSLDNRRANLRLATRAQNSYNRRKIKNATSKYIGVSFDKQKKKWQVQIRRKEKNIWLGRFKSEIEAARAYDEAAKKYHGEFARLNFPPPPFCFTPAFAFDKKAAGASPGYAKRDAGVFATLREGRRGKLWRRWRG
jgi:hypothetical protein